MIETNRPTLMPGQRFIESCLERAGVLLQKNSPKACRTTARTEGQRGTVEEEVLYDFLGANNRLHALKPRNASTTQSKLLQY